MADAPTPQPEIKDNAKDDARVSLPIPASSLTPEAQRALEKIAAEEPKALVGLVAAFRSTTTFGPDPETAKIMAQAEMHTESSRLQGYQAMLQNRDKQASRDHEFRTKELNHRTMLQVVLFAGAAVVAAVGLYLMVTGRQSIGTPLLVAGGMAMITGRPGSFGGTSTGH